MSNNVLQELINTIQTKKTLAESRVLLDEIDNPYTKRTKLGQVKRAEEDLKVLYLEYRKEIQSRVAFFIVVGELCEKFSLTAEKHFGCYSVDGEGFYKDLLDKVPARLYTNYTSSPGLFDHFMSAFSDRAVDIEIIGFPAMYFESKYKKLLTGKVDALELLKRVFNDKVGSMVVGLDAIEKVSSKAVNDKYVGKIIPVLLHTSDETLAKDLAKGLKEITQNVFIVSTGKDVSEDVQNISTVNIKTVTKNNVEQSLITIKENLS